MQRIPRPTQPGTPGRYIGPSRSVPWPRPVPQIRGSEGFGEWTPYQAACAGMGADGPYQAACAGVVESDVGQYYAMGPVSSLGGGYELSGCGPQPLRPFSTDEGISPNLASAEQALSIAESMGDIPGIPTITPSDTTIPVGADYASDRQAIFAGQDGIFGGSTI